MTDEELKALVHQVVHDWSIDFAVLMPPNTPAALEFLLAAAFRAYGDERARAERERVVRLVETHVASSAEAAVVASMIRALD
jgi:hypothetical protein